MKVPLGRKKSDTEIYTPTASSSTRTNSAADDEFLTKLDRATVDASGLGSGMTTSDDLHVGVVTRSGERDEMMNKINELEQRLLDTTEIKQVSVDEELHSVLVEMEQERSKILNKLKESKIILDMKSMVISDLSTSKDDLQNELQQHHPRR